MSQILLLNASAYVAVGSTSTNSIDPAVNVNRTLSTGTDNAHGFSDCTNYSRTGSGIGAYNCYDARGVMSGTGNFDHYNSYQSFPTLNITGTVGTMLGFSSLPTITSGTVTRLDHLSIADAMGSGTINTQRGLFIADLSKGSNNHAVYTEGDTPSRFGKVGIGIDAPATNGLLHVYGTPGGSGEQHVTNETADTGAAFYRIRTNTNLRWDMGVPASSNEFVLRNASGTNVLKVTQDGDLSVRTPVAPKTSSHSVSSTESRALFTNEGASTGITFTLPSAASGLEYRFYVQNANTVTVTAASGDTLRQGGIVTGTGGSIASSTTGSCIRFIAINNTEWIAESAMGAWA